MHLFYNRSGSDSEMEQSSSGSPLHLLVWLALIITLWCLFYIVFYVSKYGKPKSCRLEEYLLFLWFLWSCSWHKRLPGFGKGQQSRSDTAGFRFILSLIVLGKVSRWCLYSEWEKLRPSAEITFLSHRSWGDSRACKFLTVLCWALQTPAALQINLWGLNALFPNLRVDKLLIEGAFPHRFLY